MQSLPYGQIQAASKSHLLYLPRLWILGRVCASYQTTSLLQNSDTGGDIPGRVSLEPDIKTRASSPLPASTFPPDIERAHSCACEIQRGADVGQNGSADRQIAEAMTGSEPPRLTCPGFGRRGPYLLPPRPPISAAIFRKLSTFLCKFPSGMSRLSLPHSQEKTQPPGALAGIGGTGFRISGSC